MTNIPHFSFIDTNHHWGAVDLLLTTPTERIWKEGIQPNFHTRPPTGTLHPFLPAKARTTATLVKRFCPTGCLSAMAEPSTALLVFQGHYVSSVNLVKQFLLETLQLLFICDLRIPSVSWRSNISNYFEANTNLNMFSSVIPRKLQHTPRAHPRQSH